MMALKHNHLIATEFKLLYRSNHSCNPICHPEKINIPKKTKFSDQAVKTRLTSLIDLYT